MNVKKWFRPFEEIHGSQKLIIVFTWLVLIIAYWVSASSGTKHLFPTPGQVWDGFQSLYNEGLVVHIASSLGLFFKAILFSVIVSLIIIYILVADFQLVHFFGLLNPQTGC